MRTGDGRKAVWTLIGGAAVAIMLLATTASAQQQTVSAQPSTSAPPPSLWEDRPPVAVGGWRYEKDSSEGIALHRFVCDNPGCGSQSLVSYMVGAPDSTTTYATFQQQQDEVVRALYERAEPGTTITVLGIRGDEGSGLAKMFEVRRLTVFPGGGKEYRVTTILLGRTYSASLISTSPDEKASADNNAIFAVGLALFTNMEKPQTIMLNLNTPKNGAAPDRVRLSGRQNSP